VSIYETDQLLDQYLLFHYGTAEDQMPFPFGPREARSFPVRCVSEFLPSIGRRTRALDLGCAVGRSTFELSRWADEVIGIDRSHNFIQAAQSIGETGRIRFRRLEEGTIYSQIERQLPGDLAGRRVRFEVGDALNLRSDLGEFDLLLTANLIDRVPSPTRLLDQLGALTQPGGYLILTSPFTWLEEFTPRKEWLTNVDGAMEQTTFDAIRTRLTPRFELLTTKELPFLIREHARKYQWSVAHGSLWRRRV
jgi:putative 4-mercaptohistidine N1-methyltranferase